MGAIRCVSLAVACAGCAGAPARLSDGWVMASGRDGGAFLEQPRAVEGNVLAAVSAGRPCLPDTILLSLFGPVCAHESENPASSAPSGELSPGIPAPTREVRWYCGGSLVVRVVLERCASSGGGSLDGVHPVEIAFATHPQGG